MANKRSFLIIDDDAGDVELLRRSLVRACPAEVDFVHLSSPCTSALEILRQDVDLIFLDYVLGAQTGLEILKAIRAAGDLRPVIILTGQGDEHIAAELMRSGADDYLIKGQFDPDALRRAINGACTEHQRRKVNLENQELLEKLRATTDVLEKKNRRLAELYETAHQFVDNVSHEFRTPLAVIREFASIIDDGLAGPTTDEQREYLGIVIQRVDDLSIMVDDMLDTSKIEAGLLGIARADHCVEEIIERVRPTIEHRVGSKASLKIELDDNLPSVYCDAEKIARVLINLVVNALKYGGEAGNVLLAAQVDADVSQVLFSVSDNGPGIAPENLKLIFERFRQVENEGSAPNGFGLGLDIARQLVHLNYGSIAVRSDVGVGSTFTFTVPVSDRLLLVQRYRKCMQQRLADVDCAVMTLTCAHIQTDLAESAGDGVQRFLQSQIRQNDLLIRLERDSWLILAATNGLESRQCIERIRKAQLDFNRTRPGAALPNIDLKLARTAKLNEPSSTFLAGIKSMLLVKEPACG